MILQSLILKDIPYNHVDNLQTQRECEKKKDILVVRGPPRLKVKPDHHKQLTQTPLNQLAMTGNR